MNRRVHDRGGRPEAGPINQIQHDLSLWEKQTDALHRVLSGPGKHMWRVDELRRAIESIKPEHYEKFSYYERWITAIETLLVERGILSREEIDQRVEAADEHSE